MAEAPAAAPPAGAPGPAWLVRAVAALSLLVLGWTSALANLAKYLARGG